MHTLELKPTLYQNNEITQTANYNNLNSDLLNQEIIVHKNQSSIFDFLKPTQTTIYDFI